jgi:hypothetical protein
MAILFNDSVSEYLGDGTVSGLTAEPITLAGWFYHDAAQTGCIVGLADASVADTERFLLLAGRGGGNDQVSAFAEAATDEALTGTYSRDVWNHGAAVFTSNSSRTAYLNGVAGTANTNNSSVTGIDAVAIGRSPDSTPSSYMSGRVAEVGIWDVALTTGEIEALAAGVTPLQVRPGNLMHYWPLWGNNDPAIDLVGGVNLTWNNGPEKATHSPAIYPGTRYAMQEPAAASSTALPLMNHHMMS